MELSVEELRRYLQLDRKRVALGLQDQELADWEKVKGQLARHFGLKMPEIEGDESLVVTTRVKATFNAFADHRQTSLLTSFSRGGAFINTAFALEVGAKLEVDIAREDQGDEISVPCEVVFNNIGEEFSVHGFGMVVRFGEMGGELRVKFDALYEQVFMDYWNSRSS